MSDKSKLELEYTLDGAGWATLVWKDGARSFDITASYLHDSLSDLARSAIDLLIRSTARIVLFDEPGEHQILLTKVGDNVDYQIRAFDDWASWGIGSNDKYQIVATGSTSLRRYRHQVANILFLLHQKHGFEGYKEVWIEHDFPIDLYRKLQTVTR